MGYVVEDLRNKWAYKKDLLKDTCSKQNYISEITTVNMPSDIDIGNDSIDYISRYRIIIDSNNISYKKVITPCCVHKNRKLWPIPNRGKVFESLSTIEN